MLLIIVLSMASAVVEAEIKYYFYSTISFNHSVHKSDASELMTSNNNINYAPFSVIIQIQMTHRVTHKRGKPNTEIDVNIIINWK